MRQHHWTVPLQPTNGASILDFSFSLLLTNGPVFNDYHSVKSTSARVAASTPDLGNVLEEKAEEPVTHTWTTVTGRTMEAEFLTAAGGHAILKSSRRKQIKIPLRRLSEEDRKYIALEVPPDLDINFSKTTKPRKFGPTEGARTLTARGGGGNSIPYRPVSDKLHHVRMDNC